MRSRTCPTTRRHGGILLAAVVALGSLALAGCGLPSDESANELSPDDVPFDLMEPAPVSVPDAPTGDATRIANLYFQSVERLIAVPAEVDAADDPTVFDPQAAVTRLLEGRAGLGVPAGVRNAIPSGTRLLGAQVRGDTVTLNLSDDLSAVESSGLVFAIAQLVYTAAGIDAENPDGTYQVVIQIDGETITVPDDEGVELRRPVSPSDYPTLRPVTTRAEG